MGWFGDASFFFLWGRGQAGHLLGLSISKRWLDTTVDVGKDRNMLLPWARGKIRLVLCCLVNPVCFMQRGPKQLCGEGILAAGQPSTMRSWVPEGLSVLSLCKKKSDENVGKLPWRFKAAGTRSRVIRLENGARDPLHGEQPSVDPVSRCAGARADHVVSKSACLRQQQGGKDQSWWWYVTEAELLHGAISSACN